MSVISFTHHVPITPYRVRVSQVESVAQLWLM
jgi:hypothetical protein